MRKIKKFKAVNKKTNEVGKVLTLEHIISVSCRSKAMSPDLSDFDMLEYIGKSDSVGNQIYEDDTISIYDWGWGEDLLCRATVVWDDEKLQWSWKNNDTGEMLSIHGKKVPEKYKWENVLIVKS